MISLQLQQDVFIGLFSPMVTVCKVSAYLSLHSISFPYKDIEWNRNKVGNKVAPWFWNIGQTSRESQNKEVSVASHKVLVLQKLKKNCAQIVSCEVLILVGEINISYFHKLYQIFKAQERKEVSIWFCESPIFLTFQDSVEYEWSDSWYAPYRKWRYGVSNNAPSGDGLRCVTMGTDGLWAPTNCDDEYPFVCEFDFGKVFPESNSSRSKLSEGFFQICKSKGWQL